MGEVRIARADIDWRAVIAELRARGYTMQRIADSIRAPRSTVAGWMHERHEPRFSDGARLLDLWSNATGRNTTEAPCGWS